MCPGWRGWQRWVVSRHHGKAWGEHHPAGETEAHTAMRGAGGEGGQHVPPVSLPCHPCQGWQGGVAGAWRAGAQGGEGGWGGEEGEVRGCQNQLRAVQTPGQLCGVARETRHSWSTTGPCLPRRLLLGLPTAWRAAGGAAAHRPIPPMPACMGLLILGSPHPIPCPGLARVPVQWAPLPGRAAGHRGLAVPRICPVAGAGTGMRQRGAAGLPPAGLPAGITRAGTLPGPRASPGHGRA